MTKTQPECGSLPLCAGSRATPSPEETAASKSPLVVQAEAFALFYLEVSGACLRLCEVSGQNRYLRIAGSAIGPSVAVGCALHASNVP